MLNRIESLIYPFWKKYFFKRSLQFLSQKQSNEIYIFDIDNTLADTGKILAAIGRYPGFIRYFTIYKKVQRIDKIADLARQAAKTKSIIFLSARSFWYFTVTETWLKKNISHQINPVQIVLIRTPEEKIEYLKTVCTIYNQVHYYDDLSYNHEQPDILLYSDIIARVKKLPLHYYGLDYINNL